MKVNTIKQTDHELKIEIEDSGHGLCNLLQKRLLEERSVDMAGYDVPHPLSSIAVIYVRTKGETKPVDVLKKATDKARAANAAFGEALDKALKA